MLVGVPKEIKTHEYRVGLVPESIRELVTQSLGAAYLTPEQAAGPTGGA